MHSSRLSLTIAAVAAVLILAGCSGSPQAGSAPDASGSAASTADLAAAQAGLDKYAEATPFPVTTPLKTLPTGANVAYVECGTPFCALFGDLMQAPAELLGMDFTRVDAGTSADDIAKAFDAILADDYEAVIVPAIQPALWSRYLDQLNDAGIPVISSGNPGLDSSQVVVNAGASALGVNGRVLADWVTVESGGPAEIALYVTPEAAQTLAMADAFSERLAEVDPGAKARIVEIPVAQFGSTAPQIVVDDLLAHPDTTTIAFTLGEAAIGLPSALKAAGIEGIRSIQTSPVPATLDGIKSGDFTAGFALDAAVMAWTLVDSAARAIVGQDIDQAVADDELVMQIVTADNLPDDNSNGWTGYPDFRERFAKLWGVTL